MFWRQTPKTYRLWMEARLKASVADHRHDVWLRYVAETLSRSKRLPPFEKMAGRDPFKKQSVEEMKAAFGLMAGPVKGASA